MCPDPSLVRMTGRHVVGESAKEGNKELLIIPGASHVDLYDDVAGVIPFDKMEAFFKENLKSFLKAGEGDVSVTLSL